MLRVAHDKYKLMYLMHPIKTKIATSVVIQSISDFVIQYYESVHEKKKFKFDWFRNFKLASYGVFSAYLLHIHYSVILTKVKLQGLKFKSFFFAYNLMFQLPSFGLLFTIYTNYLWRENPDIKQSFKKFKIILKNSYMYWPFVNLAILHFIPNHLVQLVTSLCSFGWNMTQSHLNYLINNSLI